MKRICLLTSGIFLLYTFQFRWTYVMQKLKSVTVFSVFSSKSIVDPDYELRLERVKNVCQKHNLNPSRSLQKNFPRHRSDKKFCNNEKCSLGVDLDAKILACIVAKVGATTIKHYLVRLTNNDTSVKQEPQTLNEFHVFADNTIRRIKPYYYEKHEMDKYFKFFFVRHPFERLVSAFVDKTRYPTTVNHYFYKAFWIPAMKQDGRKHITEFSKPTFREFVRYLLRLPVEEYQKHWAPYWLKCQPCLINYDFMGKLENGNVDVPYALQHYPVSNMTLRWNAGHNTTAITKQFFEELTVSEIFALYTKYYLDFELFGYSIDEYLEGKDVREIDLLKLNLKL